MKCATKCWSALFCVVLLWCAVAFVIASRHAPNPSWANQQRAVLKQKKRELKALKAAHPYGRDIFDQVAEEMRAREIEDLEQSIKTRWLFHVFPGTGYEGYGKGHEDLSRLLPLIIPAIILSVPLWLMWKPKNEPKHGDKEAAKRET